MEAQIFQKNRVYTIITYKGIKFRTIYNIHNTWKYTIQRRAILTWKPKRKQQLYKKAKANQRRSQWRSQWGRFQEVNEGVKEEVRELPNIDIAISKIIDKNKEGNGKVFLHQLT